MTPSKHQPLRFFLPALLLLIPFLVLSAEPSPGKPNIIVLLVDDWGWKDAECLGSDFYKTPHLNQFARESMHFVNGYSACTVCSPTRAALLTGQSPARLHVTDFIAGHVRPKAKLKVPDWTMKLEHRHTTLAEALKERGYRTAHIGKWHLMPRGQADMTDYYPESHGFDVNIGGNEWGQPGSYFHPYQRNQTTVSPLPPGGHPGEYLTDRLTSEAISLASQWKSNPFFLYFAFYNVHTPLQAKPDYVAAWKDQLEPGLLHHNPTYAAMIQSLDENVGRLMAFLKEENLWDQTIIILTGDNGGLDRNGNPTDNSPLREGKGHVYEGGVRVPTWIRWPGTTQGGTRCLQPVITMDYFPTLLEIVDGHPTTSTDSTLDGVSLVPLLKNPQATWSRQNLFWHYPHYHSGGATPYSAVRQENWRLVEFHEDASLELYDLSTDPGETQDLSQKYPERTQDLRTLLHQWRQEVGAQMPTPNPNYEPSTP